MKQEGEMKSNYHNFGGHRFDLQNTHGDSQPTITLISGRPKPSTDFTKQQTDKCTHTYM